MAKKKRAVMLPVMKHAQMAVDLNTPTARYYIRQSRAALAEGRSFPFGIFEDAPDVARMIWGALDGWSTLRVLRGRIEAMERGQAMPERDRYDPFAIRRKRDEAGVKNSAIAVALGVTPNTVSDIMRGGGCYVQRVRTLAVDMVERYILEALKKQVEKQAKSRHNYTGGKNEAR